MKTAFLTLFCLSLTGCIGGSEQEDSSEVVDTGTYEIKRTTETDGGSWSVAYEPSPDPIPTTDNFKLYVTISDIETGELVLGADVEADAAMPEHNHGMNTSPVVTEVDGGQYEVTGMQFHMTGHWRIDLEITVMGETEAAVFHVECCE